VADTLTLATPLEDLTKQIFAFISTAPAGRGHQPPNLATISCAKAT
jgi:hypothetical protein